jgi:hypothetical protein
MQVRRPPTTTSWSPNINTNNTINPSSPLFLIVLALVVACLIMLQSPTNTFQEETIIKSTKIITIDSPFSATTTTTTTTTTINNDDDETTDDNNNNQPPNNNNIIPTDPIIILDNNDDRDTTPIIIDPSLPPQYRINPKENVKYFVYQPSGGWGNQRFILRWAMRAANAMDRVLIVPMIAPHIYHMWYGYDRLNATQMVGAHRVLDLEALSRGLVRGLRVHTGRIPQLRTILANKTWKAHIKEQFKIMPDGKQGINWLTENAIRFHWRKKTEDVIFWKKGSMWMCCSGGELMTPFIMFNRPIKILAKQVVDVLFGENQLFDAVHVRRGGGHTRIDRRTADHYIDLQMKPNNLDGTVPLYVATDEKNLEWFDSFKRIYKVVRFWRDVQIPQINDFLDTFPGEMRGDVIGFIEQMICTRARRWTGSDGSTFTASIQGMRKFPTLREIDWLDLLNKNKRMKKIYSGTGEGASEDDQPGGGGTSGDDLGVT